MKFCTIETKDARGRIEVDGNEIMACVVKTVDRLGLDEKKPKRLIEPNARVTYEPRIIFAGKQGKYYVLKGQKKYLSLEEEKQLTKAIKRAKKMIKKGELQ